MINSHKRMTIFPRNKAWLYYLPIVAVPFLLFGIPLLGGKVLYWGTAGLQFVPWREFAYTQLDQGVLPLWNPLNGMGAPLLANYQLGFFYPPGWLTVIGHWIAGAPGVAWIYTVLVPAHLAWAGMGMAVLLRSLGVNRLGQVIAGIAFSMCGYFVARASFFSMIWTGAWMPWILWAASGIASPFHVHGDAMRSFWLVFSSCMMLLAGHAQLGWYVLLFSGIWIFLGAWFSSGIKRACITALTFAGLIAVAVLLAGIQLAPTFEYLLESQRAAEYEYIQAMTYSFWPWRLLTFLNPEMFGNPGLGDYWGYAAYWEDAVYLGVIPLFLALDTVGLLFRKRAHQRKSGFIFLWAMAVIGLVLALGTNTPIYSWLYQNIPTFNLFQAPTRWMIWTITCLCLLAGFSADSWHRPEGRALRNTRLVTAGFVAVFIGALMAGQLLAEIKPGLTRAFIIFSGLGTTSGVLALAMPADNTKKMPLWNFAVILIVSLDLLGASLFLNPFVSTEFYHPDAKEKIKMGLDNDSRIFISAEDEYALKFDRYLRFTDIRLTPEIYGMRQDLLPNLNLLYEVDSVNNFDPLIPERYDTWMKAVNAMDAEDREPYLAFMGVDTVIGRDENGESQLTHLALAKDNLIQEYFCMKRVESPEEALNATLEKISVVGDAAQCIIVEGYTSLSYEAKRPVVAIASVEQGYDRIRFRVDSERPVWLRIGVTWYPGWAAKIDGVKTTVYHADYVFSGIYVQEGSHEVFFYYKPVSFLIGVGMSLTGGLIIICHGWYCSKRRSRHQRCEPGLMIK